MNYWSTLQMIGISLNRLSILKKNAMNNKCNYKAQRIKMR